MLSCSQFLLEFSDYRDGLLNPAERAAMEAHLAGCSACASYSHVVSRGVEELRSVPEIEPSDDFLPRLQYRLYALEDREGLAGVGRASGASVGFVVGMAMMIGAAAWVPVLKPRVATVELPPAMASAPHAERPVHALFRSGPLLLTPSEVGILAGSGSPSLFSRYTSLRSSAYASEASLRR